MDKEEYLAEFKQRHTIAEVLQWLNRAAKLQAVVIGEAIIDEYIFCKVLGVSSKDPIVAALRGVTETYAGGSLAIANHLTGICDEVRLIAQLGEIDRREEFIRGGLRANVTPIFITKPDAPTIVKTRFIDNYTRGKMLEIYSMDDTPDLGEPPHIKTALSDALSQSDLVLAADYGHGFITPKIVSKLWSSGVFLCVNSQSNAGNRGFNPVSKWRRADYVCLANHEVDIETRQRDGEDCEKLLEVARRIACPRWMVTRGKFGTLTYDARDEIFHEAPALAVKVVDRVGAGDAVFAVTSLLAKLGAPWDILAFVGNVAGAVAVEILGNQKAVTRDALEERISELLKG